RTIDDGDRYDSDRQPCTEDVARHDDVVSANDVHVEISKRARHALRDVRLAFPDIDVQFRYESGSEFHAMSALKERLIVMLNKRAWHYRSSQTATRRRSPRGP